MKRALCFAAVALIAPVGLQSQSTAQIIERAVAPLSARAQDGAAVVRWNADHTYEFLREGSNGYVCYDRSGEPGRPAFAVQCTSMPNLERVAQNRRFEAEAAGDRDALRARVAEADADGTRVLPMFGSVWINMNGADRASASRHVTIAVPHATAESLGFPDSGGDGAVWLMSGGTSEAHLMAP